MDTNKDQCQALSDLQIKVADLESRLSLLAKWISSKFGNDPSFPETLKSTIFYEENHDAETNFVGFINPPNCQVVSIADSVKRPRRHTRKQQLSNIQGAVLGVIPINPVKQESEIRDDPQGIRVVDMASILNPTEDQPRPTASRTRQPYVCTTCNRKFRTKSVLDAHKMTHCYVQITASDSSRVQPFLNETVEEPVQAPLLSDADQDLDFQPVDHDFDSDSDTDGDASWDEKKGAAAAVKRTIKAPRNVGDFVCKICDNRFTLRQYMMQHMKSQHHDEYIKIVRKKAKPYIGDLVCPICKKKYANQISLRSHLRIQHAEEYRKHYCKLKRNVGPFDCSVCQKKFARNYTMKQHLKLFHAEVYKELLKKLARKNTSDQGKAKQFVCTVCKDLFKNWSSLKNHKIRFHPEEYKNEVEAKRARKAAGRRAFRCTSCKDGKYYATGAQLQKHKLEAHNISFKSRAKVKCGECQGTFSSSTTLRMHQRFVHLKERPLLCPECGKGFPKKYDLQVHMETHSEVRSYKCQLCPKTFRQRSGLDTHKRTRHANSKVQCFQCGQFFAHLKSLSNHEKDVHSGIRPHGCPKCDKSFKKKTHLNYHLKTHENPNARKRGLNKERGFLPKREPNRFQILQTTTADDAGNTETGVNIDEINFPNI